MLKYFKHFLPCLSAILYLAAISMGEYYPVIFLIGFSLFLVIGDYILPRDKNIQQFSYPSILDSSMYINLPILSIVVILTISILSNTLPQWNISILDLYYSTDFISLKNSFNLIDKIALIIQTTLFIGILGIVPGHELTHRTKNKFDMFVGNWLLAFSWDCTFAIEHVYGHHRNACLPDDPASAKRGENIYSFIIKAIYTEHVDGWKIENNRLKTNGLNPFSIDNRMFVGYCRSSLITILAFLIGGWSGILYFLICAILAKSFLETINYVEHYGLVRKKGERMQMRHSWNSNHLLSSVFLCNVTRHSDHHRRASLKFWELHPCPENAPMTPYGYLAMLYIVLLAPFLYQRIMEKKLEDWELHYASTEEKKLINTKLK